MNWSGHDQELVERLTITHNTIACVILRTLTVERAEYVRANCVRITVIVALAALMDICKRKATEHIFQHWAPREISGSRGRVDIQNQTTTTRPSDFDDRKLPWHGCCCHKERNGSLEQSVGERQVCSWLYPLQKPNGWAGYLYSLVGRSSTAHSLHTKALHCQATCNRCHMRTLPSCWYDILPQWQCHSWDRQDRHTV